MRKLVLVLLAGALAAPASASAAVRDVSMKGNRFSPSMARAVTGDTVRWTNNEVVSTTIHNVRSSQFPGSDDLARGESYAWTFGAPGSYRYECTRHAGMRGSVIVADVHLAGPVGTLTHGAAARFTGLAKENTDVTIHAADGAQVGAARSASDGSFAVRIPMIRPGSYYAASGGLRSRAVRVAVRPRLALKARRSGRRLVLTVSATPSQARATVVVERQQRARWVRIARGRLNASSKATFRVPRRAMKVRARTTRGVRGYAAATSRALAVR